MYIHARPGEHRTRASVWLAATDSPPVEAVGPDIEAVVGMVADELRVHRRVEHDLFRHTPYIDLQREEDQWSQMHYTFTPPVRTRVHHSQHTHTHTRLAACQHRPTRHRWRCTLDARASRQVVVQTKPTQVPPSREFSTTAAFAPKIEALLAAPKPPEPAPITSTSNFLMAAILTGNRKFS